MAVAELPVIAQKEQSLWEKSFRRLLRNRVAVISTLFIAIMLLIAIFADYLTPFTFAEQDLLANNAVPRWMLFMLPEGAENYVIFSDKYPFSADHLGRDILTRTIFGARVSLSIAFAGSFVSLMVGIIYGMVSGFFGGS